MVLQQPAVTQQFQQQPWANVQQCPKVVYAEGALNLAVILTYFCLCIFCFWSTLCTAVAWQLALAVSI